MTILNAKLTLVNMTPHPVTLVTGEGEDVRVIATIPASGKTIRLASSVRQAGVVEVEGLDVGVPISETVFGEPEGLPEFSPDTAYIVSQIVKTALPFRRDLLVPAEVVRNSAGIIIGCRSLGQ